MSTIVSDCSSTNEIIWTKERGIGRSMNQLRNYNTAGHGLARGLSLNKPTWVRVWVRIWLGLGTLQFACQMKWAQNSMQMQFFQPPAIDCRRPVFDRFVRFLFIYFYCRVIKGDCERERDERWSKKLEIWKSMGRLGFYGSAPHLSKSRFGCHQRITAVTTRQWSVRLIADFIWCTMIFFFNFIL